MKRDYYVVLMAPQGPIFLMDETEHPMKFWSPELARAAMHGHPTENAWVWYIVGFDTNGGTVQYGVDVFATARQG